MADLPIVLAPATYARLLRAAEWLERNLMRGPGAAALTPPQAEVGWALTTTGTADGNGHYSADITVPKVDGSGWDEYTGVKLKPISGTLANATRYAARPAGTAPGGEELWVVVGDGAGSSSSLTVQEVDGSPSVTSVTTITTNQAQGLRTTSGGAGIAALSVDDASTTQAGVVSTSTQSFAGNKFFTGKLVGAGTADDQFYLQAGNAGSVYTQHARLGYQYAANIAILNVVSYVDLAGSISSCSASFQANTSLGTARVVFGGQIAGAAVTPSLCITDSTSTLRVGGTATTGGLTFVGGLYISGTATGIGGGGTVGTVPLFDGTGTIADSGITDNGTTVGFTRAIAGAASAIAGGVTDYDDQSVSGGTVIHFNLTSSGANLTGITAGTSGRVVVLQNTSSSKTLTIKHDSASSTAANRFYTPGSADYALGPYAGVVATYNATLSRWLLAGGA